MFDLDHNANLVSDVASLFSVVCVINTSATHLNNHLRKISNRVFQWKMRFNPDPNKQTQKAISFRKLQKISRPSIYFNSNPIN